MFPTTIWDVVRDAGRQDPEALERFASDYRAPVLEFVRRRVRGADAEDLCQEVFVRLLKGGVLAKADAEKGSFRSLLKTITSRVVIDWFRRRKDLPSEDVEPAAPEPDFDKTWAVHLTERALARLREESAGSYEAIRAQLGDEPVDRRKLWLARRKLSALVRREIALTCRSPEEIAEEAAVLAPYLKKS